jgi:AraC-like DNA-binding protein
LFYNFPASLSTDNLIGFGDAAVKDELPACIDESAEKTFAHLEKEFSKRIYRLNNPGNVFLYVEAAINCIIREKGNVKMQRLEKITGVSSRYLERSFQQWVGISPKQFCSIIKYSRFINYKKNNPAKTLTECAYESQFTDQSHLVRLSNIITGQSPKNYFNRPNHINNFFLEA